jgi:hypothetical protein
MPQEHTAVLSYGLCTNLRPWIEHLEVGILCGQLRHFCLNFSSPSSFFLSVFFNFRPGPGRSSPKHRCNSKNTHTRDLGSRLFSVPHTRCLELEQLQWRWTSVTCRQLTSDNRRMVRTNGNYGKVVISALCTPIIVNTWALNVKSKVRRTIT